MSSNFHKRKNIRLKNYNYAQNGYYFIAICSFKNNSYIGDYRELIEKILLSLPAKFKGLRIYYK